jgi:ABC-type oligopeptide transport system substrate-binding subunit
VNFSEVDITVPTHDAAFILFQSDQSEAFSNVMPRDEQTLGQPYYHEQPTLEFHGLLFPWHNAPFDDLNARRAFCLAINRDQYNQQILHSDAMPSWHILPQGMDGFNANLRGLDGALTTGDNSLAKHYWQLYLAAHHHQVPSIQLNVLSQSNPDYLKASTLLANTWNQAFGIKTEPDRTAWGHGPGWQNAIQVAQDVAIADYSDPQSILSTFTLLNGAYHGFPTIINLPTLNPLLSQADALYDMSQRFPLYQRAEQLLIDNVAFCPVFQYQSYYRLRTWVKGGFDQTAQLNWPLSAWQNAYIAKH